MLQFYGSSSPANACVAVDVLHLEPGEQAVVPVCFDKLTPAEDFVVGPLPDGLAVVGALPGACSGSVQEMSLCVENLSVVDVTLERGDVVATVVAGAAPGFPDGQVGTGPGNPSGRSKEATGAGQAARGAAPVSGAAPVRPA